jgi:hypothetical protein
MKMTEPIMSTAENSKRQLGITSLSLAIAGVLAAVAVDVVAWWLWNDIHRASYLAFLGFEIAALITGILSWSSPLGKAGALCSATLSVGSLLFLA